jgi:zinc protease
MQKKYLPAPYKKKSVCFFVSLLFFISGLSACGYHSATEHGERANLCISQGWPHYNSDLQPDPALSFGTLPNGLRYVIKENHQPEGRVAIYLNVQAGSLHETDEQRGLAHFLEHMLFNGTDNYPPGTVIEFFQSIGMAFGADTNAHVNFDETVYKIFMVSGEPQILDEGMLVLADFARRALILEKEVDRERGVILAEKMARDTTASRLLKARLNHKFAGTRLVVRDPIGIKETLLATDATKLREFYDSWYRPDNMIVVLVGDVSKEDAEKAIYARFADLRAGDGSPRCFDYGLIERSEGDIDVLYLHEPDLGLTNVSISTSWNVEPRPDTVLSRKDMLENFVVTSLLANRLRHIVDSGDSPFTDTHVHSGVFLQRLGYFSMSGQTTDKEWQRGFALLEQTLSQVIRHGIGDTELVRVKDEIGGWLDKNVRTAANRRSNDLAMQIVRNLNNNEILMSPAGEQKLFLRMLEAMTKEEVNKALARMTIGHGYLLEVSGTAELMGNEKEPEEQIIRVWEESKKNILPLWQEAETIAFPYLAPPSESAYVVKRIERAGIDAITIILNNGLQVNIKQTNFKEDEVLLAVHFGTGLLSEPVPGLGRLAESVIYNSGLGRMTREQLDVALAGQTGSLKFSVKPDSFVFSGQGLNNELELLFQLVQAHLDDPAFRESVFTRVMTRFAQSYHAMEKSVDGTVQLQNGRFFSGNNPRYSMPAKGQFMQLELDQVRDWLRDLFINSGLEISVVGDIDPEQVISLVQKYFSDRGGLEKIKAYDNDNSDNKKPVHFPAGMQQRFFVATEDDKATVVVGWLSDDFWDIHRTRRLIVLSSVFSDRLRTKIREELGVAYSPWAYHFASRVDDGYGLLRVILTVAPDKVDKVWKAVEEISADLAANRVSEEELQRIVAPGKTSIRDSQRTNQYWLKTVLSLSARHPEQLQWPLTLLEDYGSITSKEIHSLAKQYLFEGNRAGFIVLPIRTPD